MLNRLVCKVCRKNMLWPMKLLDLGIGIYFFPLVVLSQLIVKHVIRFAKFF